VIPIIPFILFFTWNVFGALEVIGLRVRQETVTCNSLACSGTMEFSLNGDGSDSLLVGIQISSDSGAAWGVPMLSDFFMRLSAGSHSVPFTVKGTNGQSCRAMVTVWDTLPISGKMRMIPAGGHVYLMGDNGGTPEQKPAHPVMISRNFWMDTVEIMEDEFIEFYPGYIPEFFGRYFFEKKSPIDNCMWHWAILYCNWRSNNEGLDTCYTGLAPWNGNWHDFQSYINVDCDITKNGYRLPTEAEWEYACRAGSMSRYYWGDRTSNLGDFSWYKGNFKDTIKSVARKKPNRYGLYDMLGGMLEWIGDRYDADYYARSPIRDPAGPGTYPIEHDLKDPFRTARGGFFLSASTDLAVAVRIKNFTSARHPHAFRCVRTITGN